MRPSSPRILALYAIVILSSRHQAMALSPPRETLWSKINATVGTIPGVKLDPLVMKSDAVYIAPIRVRDAAQAAAVASILPPSYKLGNITVEVKVTDGAGVPTGPVAPASAEQLAGQIRAALNDKSGLKRREW